MFGICLVCIIIMILIIIILFKKLIFYFIIDLGAYLLPTITSIYWICTGVMNASLVSISCLLLDIKFILFFRVFELFGIYFTTEVGFGISFISFYE